MRHDTDRGSPADPVRRARRRAQIGLLVGLALILGVAPAMFVITAASGAAWAFGTALGAVVVGLLVCGQAIRPDHNTHGSQTWQNEGTPGGM